MTLLVIIAALIFALAIGFAGGYQMRNSKDCDRIELLQHEVNSWREATPTDLVNAAISRWHIDRFTYPPLYDLYAEERKLRTLGSRLLRL